jgi:hypothetical protein
MPKWLSTAGNQLNSWGFPQVPYSSLGLCRTHTFFTSTHVHQICFADTFFCVHFLETFSTHLKSVCNSEFFIPILNNKKNLGGSYLQFLLTLKSNAEETAKKKTKNQFCNCV